MKEFFKTIWKWLLKIFKKQHCTCECTCEMNEITEETTVVELLDPVSDVIKEHVVEVTTKSKKKRGRPKKKKSIEK